jgi:hypothetical protein
VNVVLVVSRKKKTKKKMEGAIITHATRST